MLIMQSQLDHAPVRAGRIAAGPETEVKGVASA